MVQFNLLPDIKMNYIKARRTKHMVLLFASLAAIASLSIMILLLVVVDGLQKKHLSDVNNDIKTSISTLKNTKDLTKILTIQNQLKTLPKLDNQKPVTSLLYGYLGQIIPAQININNLTVDFTKDTMTFTGTADSLDRINIFVDTLKFTTYSTQDNQNSQNNAFSGVVLASFARSTSNATYSINTSFNPAIFDSSKKITLTVPPNKITTRSQTDQPSASLFTTSPASSNSTDTTNITGQ
jgi:hypothetical protein